MAGVRERPGAKRRPRPRTAVRGFSWGVAAPPPGPPHILLSVRTPWKSLLRRGHVPTSSVLVFVVIAVWGFFVCLLVPNR